MNPLNQCYTRDVNATVQRGLKFSETATSNLHQVVNDNQKIRLQHSILGATFASVILGVWTHNVSVGLIGFPLFFLMWRFPRANSWGFFAYKNNRTYLQRYFGKKFNKMSVPHPKNIQKCVCESADWEISSTAFPLCHGFIIVVRRPMPKNYLFYDYRIFYVRSLKDKFEKVDVDTENSIYNCDPSVKSSLEEVLRKLEYQLNFKISCGFLIIPNQSSNLLKFEKSLMIALRQFRELSYF
jgi:hypothetical protein